MSNFAQNWWVLLLNKHCSTSFKITRIKLVKHPKKTNQESLKPSIYIYIEGGPRIQFLNGVITHKWPKKNKWVSWGYNPILSGEITWEFPPFIPGIGTLHFPTRYPAIGSHSTHLFGPFRPTTQTKDFFRLYGEQSQDATTKVRRPKMPATVSGRLQGDFDGNHKNRRSGSGWSGRYWVGFCG